MNKILKNSSIFSLQIGISGLLILILLSIFTNYITASDFGIFVLAQVYSSIAVGIANFGMLTGYERNFFIFEKSILDTSRLISAALIFSGFNMIILLLLLYLFQLEISGLIFSIKVPDNILFIIFIGASSQSLSQYFLTFLKNTGMALSYIKFAISNSIIYFSVAIFLMNKLDLGLMALVYGWSASNVILIISLFLTFRKKLTLYFDVRMFKDMFKIAFPLTPRVFFGLIASQIDKILLDIIGSTALVGLYHIGQTFSSTIFQFMTGLGKVFQPEIYRKLFAEKHINNPQDISNFILPFLYVSIFVALVVTMFSKEFMNAFISSEYFGAIPVIVILSLYYAIIFFGKITGIQMIYAKKTHISTLLMFIGIGINIGLNIPFIMEWGILGAAWATTISGFIITYIGFYVAQKYVKLIWLWRSIFLLYSVFIFGAVFALLDYSGLLTMSSFVLIMVKFVIIMIYLILGYKIKIWTYLKL